MTLWLGLSCPECGETRDLSADDRGKLRAKHPVQCSRGHRFRREDGFLHWLLETSPFGSSLISCDTVFQGGIDSLDFAKSVAFRRPLPRPLEATEIWWRTPSEWRDVHARSLHIYVSNAEIMAVLALPNPEDRKGLAGHIQFQVVGAANPGKLPGWRQVLAEAVAAYEEGRHNVAALLGNVALETFYSSIADPILVAKGMPESVVRLLHSRIPLEKRLEQGFARPLGLPCLNDAPFWKQWQNRARRPRNSLAHKWTFDREAKKLQASKDDARLLLFLHLKALCHLEPGCFDWLLDMRARKMTP